LIESKYAFYYESKPRKADKSLPFLKRFPESIKCTLLDFKDFLEDIVCMRTDKVIFKNVKFIKRNWHKFSHTMHHIWEELVKVKDGFKLLKDDFKFFVRFQKRKIDYKYDKPSYKSDIKLKQVKSDFIKFIPFSLFIIIPGAELLLPAWLVVFPNSIPS